MLYTVVVGKQLASHRKLGNPRVEIVAKLGDDGPVNKKRCLKNIYNTLQKGFFILISINLGTKSVIELMC